MRGRLAREQARFHEGGEVVRPFSSAPKFSIQDASAALCFAFRTADHAPRDLNSSPPGVYFYTNPIHTPPFRSSTFL
jgi:hypothetical protein